MWTYHFCIILRVNINLVVSLSFVARDVCLVGYRYAGGLCGRLVEVFGLHFAVITIFSISVRRVREAS